MNDVIIYTDGACSGNPGPGGWSAILIHRDRQDTISGFHPATTTNNRMEIQAAISALAALKDPSRVILRSDSKVVVNCFKYKWHENWAANGWRNTQNRPVENMDLWFKLFDLVSQHDVRFVHVKDDSGDPYNKECDRLAKLAIRQGA
jgi:ribonuclease HI